MMKRNPRPPLFASCLPILLCVLPMILRAEVFVLYDPALTPPGAEETDTPDDQGFARLSSDIFDQEGFFSGSGGLTAFDSGPDEALFAAFFTHGPFTGAQQHPVAPDLDPAEGFLLRFELAIEAEDHVEAMDFDMDGAQDRAGFSVLMLGNDGRGVLLGFWEDRIWTHDDDAESGDDLLTQAEFVDQDPAVSATLRSFELLMIQGWYRLREGGRTLLQGRVRDYRNWPGRKVSGVGILNPFDKPNNILVGDPADSAWAVARIGAITVETSPSPEPPVLESISILRPGVLGRLRLEWRAIPGEFYSLKQSPDLVSWIELEDVRANAFLEERVVALSSRDSRFFYRVELVPDDE